MTSIELGKHFTEFVIPINLFETFCAGSVACSVHGDLTCSVHTINSYFSPVDNDMPTFVIEDHMLD